MTLLCYLFAAILFAIAGAVPPVTDLRIRLIAIGLFAWLLPAVLTAAHISHS